MALKRKHVGFNTHVVKKEDLDWRNGVFTDQVLKRFMEVTQQSGVLYVPGSIFEAYEDSGDVKVPPGIAYIMGERVEIESEQTVAVGEGEDLVIHIAHVEEVDSDEHATREDDYQVSHDVWLNDGYVLETDDYTTWMAEPPDTELPLWRASKTGGVITLTDLRVYLTLGLPLPDASVVAAKIANSAVTNAKIANKAVTTGKIADLTIGEGNMGASTAEVPLIQDLQVATAGGDKVNPATAKIDYACAEGGVYEYKVFGRTLRLAKAGPIRRLKLVGTLEASGAGVGTVHLLAWLHGSEPGSYDPDDPSYDGLVDSVDMTGPDTDTIQLNLDISALGTDPDELITYAVVLVNNTAATLHLHHLTLVGLR